MPGDLCGSRHQGHDVVSAVERLRLFKDGCPERIQVDNGREFVSEDFDCRVHENGVTLDFSRPGKPTGKALIESFNGSFREQCLNANWLLSIDDARKKVGAWPKDDNDFGRIPH